jgi:hypothetical protein
MFFIDEDSNEQQKLKVYELNESDLTFKEEIKLDLNYNYKFFP